MAKFISRSEINMLIAAILRAGITWKELILSGDTKESLSVPLPLTLSIKGSHFYFEIDHHWNSYHVKFFPSLKPAAADSKLHEDIKSISDQLSGWANRVARELNEPDPWSLLGKTSLPQPELFDKSKEHEKFSESQLRVVKEYLQEIRHFLVTEMKPAAEHLEKIDERLGFLEEETKTQNKKQWMYAAIGVIVTIADGLAMSPDQAHKLFAILSELFRHLFMKLLS